MSGTVTPGQDLGELFELYTPPSEPFALSSAPPQALGIRKPRGEVHRDGDWHRSVHVWLTDGCNLLLQRRSKHKDTHPGLWDVSCAGHLSAGDDSLCTARKELEEELGLEIGEDVLSRAFVGTLPARAQGATEKHGAFACNEYQDIYLVECASELLVEDSMKLEAGEVAGVKLVAAHDVLAAWEQRAETFVPRGDVYVKTLREALAQVTLKKGIE